MMSTSDGVMTAAGTNGIPTRIALCPCWVPPGLATEKFQKTHKIRQRSTDKDNARQHHRRPAHPKNDIGENCGELHFPPPSRDSSPRP
ncbi:hypothetical protein BDW68DRAFT_164738 [Aspergillus falconensis]